MSRQRNFTGTGGYVLPFSDADASLGPSRASFCIREANTGTWSFPLPKRSSNWLARSFRGQSSRCRAKAIAPVELVNRIRLPTRRVIDRELCVQVGEQQWVDGAQYIVLHPRLRRRRPPGVNVGRTAVGRQ